MSDAETRKVCPECDHAQVAYVVNRYLDTDHDYRCKNCLAKFDDPPEREIDQDHDTRGNIAEAGRALIDADPSEVGL